MNTGKYYLFYCVDGELVCHDSWDLPHMSDFMAAKGLDHRKVRLFRGTSIGIAPVIISYDFKEEEG